MYGLKQAPRQWYRKFESFMTDNGYQKMQADHCMFVKKFEGGDFLILLLYVDNMLIVGRDHMKIQVLKKALSRSFSMKDMGPAKQILGMHIIQDRTKKLLWLSQEKYVTKVLQRFGIASVKLIGSTLRTNCKLSKEQCPKSKSEKNGLHRAGHWICCWSCQPIYEQPRKRALGCCQVDTSVPERHLESVSSIRPK